MKKVLLVEPYYAGSHKVMMDLLMQLFDANSDENMPEVQLTTMTGKKWHWRARTSALYFAQTIPLAEGFTYETIFTSCVLPLQEIIAVRSDLAGAKKIIYFHENQLVYPRQKVKDRDFQYGYNQIMSCLVADVILFNSSYNMESFLSNIKSFFKLQPDYRPKNLRESIEPKCRVLYFPLQFDKIEATFTNLEISVPTEFINIVWPHRWEFDKNPEMFFNVIFRLVDEGFTNFRLSVLGENFTDNPPIFEKAKSVLGNLLLHFGYLASKEEYYQVLKRSHVVVSTADHEFFGVAMLEAAFCGCYPIVPNALAYPEIFSKCPESFFSSADDLYLKLRKIISNPDDFRITKSHVEIDFSRFDWKVLKSKYFEEIFGVNND